MSRDTRNSDTQKLTRPIHTYFVRIIMAVFARCQLLALRTMTQLFLNANLPLSLCFYSVIFPVFFTVTIVIRYCTLFYIVISVY